MYSCVLSFSLLPTHPFRMSWLQIRFRFREMSIASIHYLTWICTYLQAIKIVVYVLDVLSMRLMTTNMKHYSGVVDSKELQRSMLTCNCAMARLCRAEISGVTANAFYSLTHNTIRLALGILQAPYYQSTYSKSVCDILYGNCPLMLMAIRL